MGKRKFEAVRMHFTVPLHLSVGKEQYEKAEEILHSDTIHAAIFASAIALFGEEKVKELHLEQTLKVSSAFPFAQEDGKAPVFFFPKPFSFLPYRVNEEDAKNNKALKKIAYLEKEAFETTLQGKEEENQGIKQEAFLFPGKEKNKENELNFPLWHSEVHQRVSIPKEGEEKDADPFYFERRYFRKGAGLFFLYEVPDEETKKIVQGAIRHLGEEGIGSYRNIGNGQFRPEFTKLELELPENADKQLMLSLFCPEKEELTADFLQESSYQLIKRGGWLSSPAKEDDMRYRKRSVYMFTEGSIFPFSNALEGKVVDLRPEEMDIGHPVHRSGKCINIPMKSGQHE